MNKKIMSKVNKLSTKIDIMLESRYIYNPVFADFESVVENGRHYLSAYVMIANETTMKGIIKNTGEIKGDSDKLCKMFMDDYIDYMIRYKNKNTIIYFHNLGKFDSFFILQHCSEYDDVYNTDLLTRGRTIYRIKISYGGVVMEIRDSLIMCPMSLKVMGERFGKVNRKSSFDHDNKISDYNNEVFRVKLLKYCENDVMTLKESFSEYMKVIKIIAKINPYNCLSLPGVSMRAFRTNYYDASSDEKAVHRLDENKDTFIRASYHGGIVDVYKPRLMNGWHYDINSLYPKVMMENEYPVGPGEWVKGNEIDIENFYGFVEVEVEVDCINIPLLPIKDKKRGLISPIGKFTGIYFSEEIKKAITLGYKIKPITGIKFAKGRIFTKFIDELYKIRIMTDKNDPMNTIAKLMMNSLYGRFGIKRDNTSTVIVSDEQLNDLLLRHDVYDYDKLNNKNIVSYNTKPSDVKMYNNHMNGFIKNDEYTKYNNNKHRYHIHDGAVQIASAITSYARLIIYEYKDENTCYSDTDSIFTSVKLSDDKVSNEKLGYMKLEGFVKEGIFISPKLYYAEYDGTKEVKKAKGFNAEELTKIEYEALLMDKEVIQTMYMAFIRNMIKMTINTGHRTKRLKGQFNKRNKVYKDGVWTGTSPIRVDGKDDC